MYEQETGTLRQVDGFGRKRYPWRGIGLDRRYLAHSSRDGAIYLHQAVWLYHHGYIPEMLDHIDGDTRNNRIENLRECTNGQNQFNSRRKSNNRSGFKGVAYRSGYRQKWEARVTVGGKRHILGRFDTPEEAALAYADGAKALVGEFFRT
jgi:hypothetical protein